METQDDLSGEEKMELNGLIHQAHDGNYRLLHAVLPKTSLTADRPWLTSYKICLITALVVDEASSRCLCFSYKM